MKQLQFVLPLAVRPAAPFRQRGRQGARLRYVQPSPRVLPKRVREPAEVLWVDLERSPEDAWYAVEDLWLRLAQRLPVHTALDGTRWQVAVIGGGACPDREVRTLLSAALDPARYEWRLDGLRGSFALSIVRDGDDLLVTIPSLSSIARWPGGSDVGWQLAGLLTRLRNRSAGGAR